MKRSGIDAMSALSRVNPFEDSISWWTSSDEDSLLATVLAESDTHVHLPRGYPANPVARRRIRVTLIAAGVMAVGLVVLVLVLVGSGTSKAFAAWTATTTTPPASQLATAASSCRAFFKDGLHLGPNQGIAPALNTLPPLVLTDSRGPYELLVYAGPTGEGECVWDASGVLGVGNSNGETLPASSDDSIGVPGVGFDSDRGSVLTYAIGHAGSHVSGVMLVLADGVRVQATIMNGFYAAWWPSRSDVVATEVTTAKGTSHQNVGDVGPNNPSSSGVGP